MNQKKNIIISLLTTFGVFVTCALLLIFYDWENRSLGDFFTQADNETSCLGGSECNGDGLCNEPCESLVSCPEDCGGNAIGLVSGHDAITLSGSSIYSGSIDSGDQGSEIGNTLILSGNNQGSENEGVIDSSVQTAHQTRQIISSLVFSTGTLGEICTGGLDDDTDGYVDCSDGECLGTTVCCSNGIKVGNETDIDCGGTCSSKCTGGKRCALPADCETSQCTYGLGAEDQAYGNTSTQLWHEQRILVQFKQQNNLLLPEFSQDVILNSEERYMGYVLGKVANMYENQGVAPLMMVRAVDQLFDYNVSDINRLSAGESENASSYLYSITLGSNRGIDTLIEELRTNLAVEYVEKEPLYRLSYTDSEASNQWFLTKLEADIARNFGALGNSQVVVAVIDNGFDLSHPDLQGALVQGRDAADNDNNPSLPSHWIGNTYGGHGTHTAGLVGAVTNNGVGIASVGGGVSIMPIKATEDGADPTYVTDAVQALLYAAEHPDVDIISMSFGGPPSTTIQAIIEAHPEKIFVAAAGNDGVQSPQYPAAYDSVVAVAASTQIDQKATFSNYGSWIDIAAPGTSIYSSVPLGAYAYQNGTSMATPIVASALGLLESLGDTNPVQTLKNTAESMPNSSAFTAGLLGAGRLNVCRAAQVNGINCFASSGGSGGVGTGDLPGGTTGSTALGVCTYQTSSTGNTVPVTGENTGTGTSTSGTNNTSSNSGVQNYPEGGFSLTVDDSSPDVLSEVSWTLQRSFETRTPYFPTGTLDLVITLPDTFEYQSRSQRVRGDGTLLDTDSNDNEIVFTLALDVGGSHSSTRSTYGGSITFDSKILSNADGSSTIRGYLYCYGMSHAATAGSVTCSSSQNWQNGIAMASDSVKISINDTNSSSTTSNSTTSSSTTSSSTSAGSSSSSSSQNKSYCGDGLINGSEQCDDGNNASDDGCKNCIIQNGWRCLPNSPSQCGTNECFTHGQSYAENNIFASCCGGLSEMITVPHSAVVTGVSKIHICYDPEIGQPFCDPSSSPSGWRIPQNSGSVLLVRADTCETQYQDYYKKLLSELQGKRTQCSFNETAYDQIIFSDIESVKQKKSIEVLLNACIIQGIGTGGDVYGSQRPVQRAELLKMVIKLMQLHEGKGNTTGIGSSGSMNSQVIFLDVPSDFWANEYINDATKRGLHLAWSTQGMMTFLKPFASVSRDDFIALLRRIPYGQSMSRDQLYKIIDQKTLITRAIAAEILVKKFMPTLQPYFYYQGQQEEYYRELADQLRGKNYKQQYAILVSQLKKLEEMQTEGKNPLGKKYDLYRMQQFIRRLMQ